MAESAHYIMRAEFEETGVVPNITDDEVHSEYRIETGGGDNGLVMLDHLRRWRNTGLLLGGKRRKIHSFLSVNARNPDELREASLVGLGLCYGLNLPRSAADQIGAGRRWTLVTGPSGAAGSWGGHCVLSAAYDPLGHKFITWGDEQDADEEWVFEYCDECYLVIDAPNEASLDVSSLTAALAEIDG
jgi:hypothetical protein